MAASAEAVGKQVAFSESVDAEVVGVAELAAYAVGPSLMMKEGTLLWGWRVSSRRLRRR